ncbi:MAG: hypothetical protein H6860_04765 [Rhodospirillales bacterium]|nr:hypothetical protein [Alphaproteobacteria bacterium]MCB9981693.1 hypothetical protein [Rhodospirillales bacterium]
MPTENPRIQVTLDKETHAILTEMAQRHDLSKSAMAKKLMRDAMLYDEDYNLSMIALERDTEDAVWIEDSDAIWE